MSELFPTDATINALSGTNDSEQAVPYPAIYEAPYYTTFYKMVYRLLDVARRAGDLRVYKDGDLTFGVRAGRFTNGDTTVDYAGATAQALTNNATNYIYLTADGTLTVNTTAFPTPSSTPHIPLGTITTDAGSYDHDDITDLRGRSFLNICAGLDAAGMAEAAAFFAGTDLSAAQAETLTDGSNADALHRHDAAGLAGSLADRIAYLTLSASDDGDGTGTLSIQLKDAAGNDLAANALLRVWIGTANDFGPDTITDFSVTTGTQKAEVTADAEYHVITDATGLAVMNIDNGGAGTLYAWAELAGRIVASGAITITSA
jgi:hypothetical protein